MMRYLQPLTYLSYADAVQNLDRQGSGFLPTTQEQPKNKPRAEHGDLSSANNPSSSAFLSFPITLSLWLGSFGRVIRAAGFRGSFQVGELKVRRLKSGHLNTPLYTRQGPHIGPSLSSRI